MQAASGMKVGLEALQRPARMRSSQDWRRHLVRYANLQRYCRGSKQLYQCHLEVYLRQMIL